MLYLTEGGLRVHKKSQKFSAV